MAVLNVLLALVVGAIIWLPSLLVFTGVPGLGRGLVGWEVLAYIAPIAFIAAPAAVRALGRDQPQRALWLVAVAPLLGLLGSILAYLVEDAVDDFTRGPVVSALAVTAVSAVAGLGVSYVASKARSRTP